MTAINLKSVAPLLIALCMVGLLAPGRAAAEYYSYEDRKGTVHFVDDMSKIPKQYQNKKQVRKDKYDDLPADERALLLERDREKLAAERRREAERQEQSRQQRDAEERKAARELRARELQTKVVISGLQVFVPVTLRNGSAQTSAMLLLDTGATSSVITPEVAERLGIQESQNIKLSVVGGKVLNARRVVLGQMEVGPVKRSNQAAVIVRQRSGQFGDGLLGMSFLAGLKYTIDFQAQTINWIP